MEEVYKGPDNIYWLFSSSAQTISAFIAFLLTGFALVISVMDGLAAKDETLTEIHDKLKIQYYQRIRFLIINTGLAIFFSLLMVYLNGTTTSYKDVVLWIAVICNVLSLVLGITFVLAIINPGRYQIAAVRILEEEKGSSLEPSSHADVTEFTQEFSKLEQTLQNMIVDSPLYPLYGLEDENGTSFPFRRMTNLLLQRGKINQSEFDQLFQINRYRNLIVHGHVKRVNGRILKSLIKLREKLTQRSQDK